MTREALLDAAADLFAERGYQAASLDDIAEAAGFTRGAIYSNFDGKEDLFLSVMARRNDELLAAYADLLVRSGEHGDALSDAASIWSATQSHDLEGLRLMLEFRLLALRNETIRASLQDFERKTEQAVERVVEQMTSAAGVELRLPAKDFATLLYVAQQGLHEHMATCASDHEGLFQVLLEMIVASGTTPPARRRR